MPLPNSIDFGQPPRYPHNNKCPKCSNFHKGHACPATGSTCRKCHGYGHWGSACPTTFSMETTYPTHDGETPSELPHYHHGQSSDAAYLRDYEPNEYMCSDAQHEQDIYDNPSDELYSLHLQSLTISSTDTFPILHTSSHQNWMETLFLCNSPIPFKVDTGSQVNVISQRLYDSLPIVAPLRRPSHKILSYSGHQVDVRGVTDLPCASYAISKTCRFYVTPQNSTPIIGASDSVILKLLHRLPSVLTLSSMTATTAEPFFPPQPADAILKEFQDVFDSVGKLPGLHHIQIRPDAVPSVSPARHIPHALREPVRQELARMQALGIIVPVTEPTTWVHPMVVVTKPNGSLRICLDPRKLNTAIRREHHPLPTSQEIFADLSGSQHFTVLDAQSAFWQIELTEESSFLCTFATPYGRFRFQRLPYGICTAS